ncbi:hypothetical protein GCM10010531_17320 [Blastococcus jejuensis]|uniref:VTT domain-containing protein n=1 Tax=Blastococcus jejuensis TaxID=351224 RepID=A0ABP6P526_9ACTN
MFTGGLLVAGGLMAPLRVMLAALPIAAVAGNLVGWWIGRVAGQTVFERRGARVTRTRHAGRTRTFFDRNGAHTVVLARFVPSSAPSRP